MNHPSKYDVIGKDYNRTRRADPYLLERMMYWLAPVPGGIYLDIGCGTGNYTIALHEKKAQFIGMDPSAEMLEKARLRCTTIDWQYGTAEYTGLHDESVNGVLACLTIHHWQNIDKGFKELFRVMKAGSRIVLFSSTPEQMRNYWLCHYFPALMERSMIQMPSYEQTSGALKKAGFGHIIRENYSVSPDLQDLFLQSGKHDPELYFRPEVRNGISTFAALGNQAEADRGLARLRRDIDEGKFEEVRHSYASDGGDYLFIIGHKSLE